MKNKNNKIPLRIKIVVALFILSIIGLSLNLFSVLGEGQGIGEIVMHDSLLILVYVFIVFGLVTMTKWGYYLALLDSLASLAKSAFAAPEFLNMINSLPQIQNGDISASRVAIVGLIPIIITLYIFYALISERKKFED
ncbi:hypothetical protein H6775_01050 [Candidatus Nomurabacteria bacterium]|nr:hypothetical protein [Candidatus Nomurabacteria bacterium]